MFWAVRKEITPSLQTNPASDHRATLSSTVPGAAIAPLEPEADFRDTRLQEISVILWFTGPWVSPSASHRFDPGYFPYRNILPPFNFKTAFALAPIFPDNILDQEQHNLRAFP